MLKRVFHGRRWPQIAQGTLPCNALKSVHSAKFVRTVQNLAQSPVSMLVVIITLGIILRVYHLGYLSLWGDEFFSRYYYQNGLRFMWTDGLRLENSPPLYYMAIGAWIQIFGAGEVAIRSLSAASSSATIILVYVLGKEIFDRNRALLASLLFSLSATQIYYAQEARPYALLLIPAAATLISCARYMRKPGITWNLAGYIISAILCIYTHATMVFFLAPCGITVLVWVVAQQGFRLDAVPIAWIAANACVGLAALPELIGMLAQVQDVQLGHLDWIPYPRLADVGAVVSNTMIGTLTPARFPGGELAIALSSVLGFALWRHQPDGRASLIALVIPGLYAGCVLLLSLLVQPMMLSRIFSWIGIPLCLLQAHALSGRGHLRRVLVAITSAVVAVSLFYQLTPDPDAKEPWRSVIQEVSLDLSRADLVVLGPSTDVSNLMYYAPSIRQVRIWAEDPSGSEGEFMAKLFGVKPITQDAIAEQINSDARVVIVLRVEDQRFLPALLLHTSSPARRLDRRCVSGDGRYTNYPCELTVLSWHEDIKR
jgi:mannosyltransferase